MDTTADWKQTKADVFWGEVAECDHVLQIYESDEVFIDTLAGFVITGVNIGDCCMIIATEAHLKALNERLESNGISVDTAMADGRYIPLVAEKMLPKFIVNDWPDEELFMNTALDVVTRGRKTRRMIRVFGEMVAILSAQGHIGPTIYLERLWNKFCEKEKFCLFCAYPKSVFNGGISSSVNPICAEHSKMISGSEKQLTDIYYKSTAFA